MGEPKEEAAVGGGPRSGSRGQADWSHTSLATSLPRLLTGMLAVEVWGLSHMPLKPPKNHSLPTLALCSLFPSPQCPSTATPESVLRSALLHLLLVVGLGCGISHL